MYRAFKITYEDVGALSDDSKLNINQICGIVKEALNEQNLPSILAKMINTASLGKDRVLDAVSIWDDWFPEIDADVFISHSSKDATLAKRLSSWLRNNYGLVSFVDSVIWGHSDKLLKDVDDAYCLNPGGETYSYESRNGSTAHVHMILSYALTRMIDKAECFIFLESHNSVTADDAIKGTYSPWIFHELATVDTIEVKLPKRLRVKKASRELMAESTAVKVRYPILGNRLIEIDHTVLAEWQEWDGNIEDNALDRLYQLCASN